MFISHYRSPVGEITLAAEGDALVGAWIEGQRYFVHNTGQDRVLDREAGTLARSSEWLDRYFAGEAPSPAELKLAPKGSDFARGVWRRLCGIPYGETVTYGALAK